jgi:hypothetical protein
MSPYDSLTALISWQPTPAERAYLLNYAVPELRKFFSCADQLLVVGPDHNKRFEFSNAVFGDKRLFKALLHPQMTGAVYPPGASFYLSKPRRLPLRQFGSTTDPVIEPEPPEEPWLPKEPLFSAMRPARPSVDHNLAHSNGRAILGRIEAGYIVSVLRAETVVLFKWGPQNPPPLGHVIAALLEHEDAFAVELNKQTMRQAPVPGFVVAQ